MPPDMFIGISKKHAIIYLSTTVYIHVKDMEIDFLATHKNEEVPPHPLDKFRDMRLIELLYNTNHIKLASVLRKGKKDNGSFSFINKM